MLDQKRNHRFKDVTGNRFGKLVAKLYLPCVWRSPNGRAYGKWECACDCGSTTLVSPAKLMNGNTSSCGCYQQEARSTNHLIHGMSDTPELWAWRHMISRCYDPSGNQWKNYGGRGISVCVEWRNDFTQFLAHIGLKPSPIHSVDRINNDGNYEPGNVRWATPKEQRANQRAREHCMRGHPFTVENTFQRKNRVQRECRICMRMREKERRA